MTADTPVLVLGIDPGLTTGWALGSFDGRTWAWSLGQTTSHLTTALIADADTQLARAIFVEEYVIGRKSLRSKETRTTLALITRLQEKVGERIVLRPAATVKPWASNRRLEAVGVELKGMRHAADAARHALYGAVRAGWAPDPLSQ
jgi:hypothetical protein